MFQSTRPRGARLFMYLLYLYAVVSFNPRARVGRDRNNNVSGIDKTFCFNPRARVGRDILELERYI